jgi:hypothetical protein
MLLLAAAAAAARLLRNFAQHLAALLTAPYPAAAAA